MPKPESSLPDSQVFQLVAHPDTPVFLPAETRLSPVGKPPHAGLGVVDRRTQRLMQ